MTTRLHKIMVRDEQNNEYFCHLRRYATFVTSNTTVRFLWSLSLSPWSEFCFVRWVNTILCSPLEMTAFGYLREKARKESNFLSIFVCRFTLISYSKSDPLLKAFKRGVHMGGCGWGLCHLHAKRVVKATLFAFSFHLIKTSVLILRVVHMGLCPFPWY